MKLSQYAKQQGISYRTAFRWWKAGKIQGYQAPTGTIIVTEEPPKAATRKQQVVIYARVSSHEQKSDLERQADRLRNYCTAKSYQITKVVKEIGSGVNDHRPKFVALLAEQSISTIVVEHKDRATRFGFGYLETLLAGQGRHLEVVNLAEEEQADLLHDLASIICSYCARRYGQRWAKRKTEAIVRQLHSTELPRFGPKRHAPSGHHQG